MRIGYLIPEFPGQTHIWMWREIVHLREWGTKIDIFSTKPPTADIKARHGFAKCAEQETYYLWNLSKQNFFNIIKAVFWAIFTRPLDVLKIIKLALIIDVDARPRWRSTLPLVIIACILAHEATARGIKHLHCHSCANSAILAMMLKRLTGIPYSLTLNANLQWWGGAIAAKFSDAKFIIVITQWLEKEVRRDYPYLLKEQVVLGRIGVDTKKWTPQQNKSQNEIFQIITVGRLHPSKGHDTLIKAVKHLLEQEKLVNLTIVGAGSELNNLKQLANQLDIANLVNFTGSLSEEQIIEQMHKTDAFVLASHAEPLGVVYMEAMAMEVPTIGTNAGGVPEIITHQHDGLLVPPKDIEALANAIILLMDNPTLRQELGRNGRKQIVQCFDSRVGANTLHEHLGFEKKLISQS